MNPGTTGSIAITSAAIAHAMAVTGVSLPDGPYETLAGYVMATLGHVPRQGEAVEVDDRRRAGTRVERVREMSESGAAAVPFLRRNLGVVFQEIRLFPGGTGTCSERWEGDRLVFASEAQLGGGHWWSRTYT